MTGNRFHKTCFHCFLVIVSLLVSCQTPRGESISRTLVNGCFWDVWNESFDAKHIKYTYRFLPNGTCYKYQYDYVGQQKQNAVSHLDKIKGETDIGWQSENDTVLTIGKTDYKILKIENALYGWSARMQRAL
jgi:hypothetical protein